MSATSKGGDLIPRQLNTVVTIDGVEIFINKTIDGDFNTFSNISDSCLKQITDKNKLPDDIVYDADLVAQLIEDHSNVSLLNLVDGDTLKYSTSSGKWENVSASSQGEANTMANIGSTGVGVYKTKVGVQLQVKKLNALTGGKITINDDTENDKIDFQIVDGSTTQKGAVQFATDGQSASSLAVQANDSRLTDSRIPEGNAGGDLTGSFPSPTLGTGVVEYANIQNVTDKRILGRDTGTAGAPEEITIGSGLSLSGKVLSSDVASTLQILSRNVTNLTVNDSTTHTTVLSYSFSANQMGTDKIIHGVVKGYIVYNSGTPKIGLEIILGTTTLYNDELGTIDAFADPRPFEVDFELVNKGVHNSQTLNGEFTVNRRHNGGPASGYGNISSDEDQQEGKIYGLSSEATNVSKSLTIKMWNSSQSSSVGFTRTLSYLEMK